MPTYQTKITASLRQAVPEVGDLVDSINGSLTQMGHSERIDIRFDLGNVTVDVDRQLTSEEESKMRSLMATEFAAKFPQLAIEVGEFTRQSGNVSQSVE